MAGMRDQTFLIMVVLADGERHGFGIIGEVRTLSDGTVELGPGTLYGALDRLAADGLVLPTRSEVVDGRNRRYYDLTDEGSRALEAEVDRREAMQVATRARLATPKAPRVHGGRRPGVAPA